MPESRPESNESDMMRRFASSLRIHVRWNLTDVSAAQLTENAIMGKVTLAANLVAALALASGAARAQSPKPLYGASTVSYGPSAVTATAGTASDARSGYVVAAVADSVGNLEVTAWQDTTKKLAAVGKPYDASGTPIVAVAAADLDSSQVVTADVDQLGKLSVRTWTVGTAGIAPLNSYTSSPDTVDILGSTPFLGIAALSATEVVTASQDSTGNLIVQAWNIPSGGEPVRYGPAWNGGQVNEIAIATLDSATFMTATNDLNQNLKVTTWGIDELGNLGVYPEDQHVESNLVGDLTPRVAIAAGTVETFNPTQLPPDKISRYAVTPISNRDEVIEVLYWQISSSGAISKIGDKVGSATDTAVCTAATMLPSAVPISVYCDFPAPGYHDWGIDAGWYGHTGESDLTEVTGEHAAVQSVSAAPAGDSFKISDPYAAVSAYFVTGALTSTELPPSVGNPGAFELQLWSYPITLPLL
jgi:hypothetical protein